MTNFPDRLAELRRLKHRATASQDLADKHKQEHADFQEQLFHDLRDAGLHSVRTDDARFDRRSTIYAAVQDHDAFRDWLIEKGLKEDYLVERESKARLNELVRDRLDAGEELPPGIGWFPREYISITDN